MAANEVNSLVKAMKQMKAKNDDASKNAFINELLFSKFLVPVNISPEPENNQIKPGSVISYMSIRNNNDGKKLLIAFTSKEEFDKFVGKNKTTHIINHPYNEVKTLVAKKSFNGFIIDPLGENVAITEELMKKIAQVAAPMQVKSEKVQVTEGEKALKPATVVPQALKDAISEYLATQENVNKCYLMETTRENQTNPTLVFVVDFDGDMRETFNGIANAARKYLKVNDTIGMMPVQDSFAAASIIGVEPFYTK